MQLIDRELTSIIDNEALAYALYTIESRAIPNMIDGFKPVHRFVVHRALQMSRGDKNKFHKVAAIGGGVSDLGYHHGEDSAEKAGVGLANTWSNNVPILDGQGNFGSRLQHEPGQARYIFARINDNFRKLYKDSVYAPIHKDEEHVPPAFYLPIVPTVLLNGISGIATGFATDILPHSLESVRQATLEVLRGGKPVEPEVSYPQFNGTVHKVEGEDNKYELHGAYKFTSRTQMTILEVPYKWERGSYIEKVLEKLEDAGMITWSDECDKKGFGFKVKFRKDYKLPEDEEARHDKIMKDFGLIERVSQNITVINEKGKLAEYNTALDLIVDFVEVRKTFVQKRIDQKIIEANDAFLLALAKAKFIKDVIEGNIVIQGKTRKQLTQEIAGIDTYKDHAEALVAMNIYHITTDEAKKLALEAKAKKEECEYWKQTTVMAEYTKDLEELC